MEKGGRSLIKSLALLILLTFSTWAGAVGSSYGPTKPHEGLYRVALKIQPSSVNVQQTMIAIFRANREAFADNNINGLRSGYTLQIPSLAEIQAISPEEAAAEVHRQNQRWRQAGHGAAPVHPAKIKKPVSAKAKIEKAKAAQSSTPGNTTSAEAYNSFANTIAGALDQLKQQVAQLVTKEQLSAVQNQIAEDEKQNSTFRQDVTQQLAQAQQQNQQLTAQVQQMNQQLAALTAQVKQIDALQKQQDQTITNKIQELVRSYLADLQTRYGIYAAIAIGALIVFWLIINLLIRRRQQQKLSVKKKTVTDEAEAQEDDTKDEYDFMNSDEGIPAKLDLARAYIDMEDFTAAEAELKEVLKKGNILQKQEAQRLLKKIK